MIRWLIIAIAVLALFIFLASLGSGMGYASAGGEVRILSKWSEAHSESGQAIAVVGDVENLNASNSPPAPTKPQTRNSPADMLLGGFLLVALALLGLFLWSNGFFSSFGGDIHEHSSCTKYKSTRRYGPE